MTFRVDVEMKTRYTPSDPDPAGIVVVMLYNDGQSHPMGEYASPEHAGGAALFLLNALHDAQKAGMTQAYDSALASFDKAVANVR